MLLIGSQALNSYIPLKRVMHDWDILMSNEEFDAFKEKFVHEGSFKHIKSIEHTHIYEFSDLILLEIHTEDGFTPSDYLLCENHHRFALLQSPVGYVEVPSLQDLYDIKRATAAFIHEPKHQADVDLIEANFRLETNTELYTMRYEETKSRLAKVEKTKYEFFHKYKIPEYIRHDYLHEVIADKIGVKYPTYLRITNGTVSTSQELFDKLTHAEKISLMVEESLVLALERWFIPQNVERGINARLIDWFFNDNEGLPTYKLLKHCCITGLKGEAEYITQFARDNFFEIEVAWKAAKQQMKNNGGLPKEFYSILFKVRDEYKAGIKVGLT